MERETFVQNPVEQIELRAYEFWEERGRPLGTPEADWFKAEHELTESESTLSKVAREVGSVVGKVVAVLSDAQRN
jgi:Protein of unknown function (DUF2934)